MQAQTLKLEQYSQKYSLHWENSHKRALFSDRQHPKLNSFHVCQQKAFASLFAIPQWRFLDPFGKWGFKLEFHTDICTLGKLTDKCSLLEKQTRRDRRFLMLQGALWGQKVWAASPRSASSVQAGRDHWMCTGRWVKLSFVWCGSKSWFKARWLRGQRLRVSRFQFSVLFTQDFQLLFPRSFQVLSSLCPQLA